MAKSKLIALGIVAVVILVPFQLGYISFTIESQLMQALSMAVSIIALIVAIMMFNKGESTH
ncbi:MAG: hypothetical protein HRT73_06265 [Flavobacteriales bacterium]|nr:hypothetical protein [Flavobacteriales bacterium]NQX97468.1 hypothetical protein [Flavobacteriales bacterium]